MQPIQFFAARAEDGALLPGATVDVFISGTVRRARLYSNAEVSIALGNPAFSDGNARVFFYTKEPRIDVRISRGGYVAPLLEEIVTTDPGDVLIDALAAAARAEAARDVAELSSGIFPDVATGMAATALGKYFSVPSMESIESLILYQNSAGVPVEIDRYPNSTAVKETQVIVQSLEQQTAPYRNTEVFVGEQRPLGVFAATDASGNKYSLLAFMQDGSIQSAALNNFLTAGLGGMTMRRADIDGWGSYVYAQRDANGDLWALSGMRDDGSFYAPGFVPGQGGARELNHIVLMGQSNAEGADAKPALSTAPTGWGALMFARGIATWKSTDNPTTPESRAASGFNLVEMVAQTYETRANAMADAYKARLTNASRFSPTTPEEGLQILTSFSGLGGRKLTELGPEDDGASGRVGARVPGGHWPTMLDDIRRAKATAAAAGTAYRLPAWIFDQGESEGDMTMYYGGEVLQPSALVASYTSKALAMAVEFDSAVRAITGQTRPIPLFVTPASYNQLTSTAWMDVADASPLVFMVGPRYQMPSAKNASNGLSGSSQDWGNVIHYNSDGQRWIGEMCAKVMHRVLNEGEDWQPLRVLSAAKVDATHIDLTFHVPRPPLVIDTTLMAKARGYGVSIYAGSLDAPTGKQPATAVELRPDGRTVRMTFASIPAGALLAVGQAYCDLGATYAVASVGVGAPTSSGFATHTVSIAGDIRGVLKPLTEEGAFLLSTAGIVQAIIRSVSFDGLHTVLTGETRELVSAFASGDALSFRRLNTYTNIRDSDNAMSINTFATGARAGKLYPLHNWACQYDGMTIQGA